MIFYKIYWNFTGAVLRRIFRPDFKNHEISLVIKPGQISQAIVF